MVKNQYIVSGEEGEVVYAMEAQERPEYEAQYIPEEEHQQEEGGGYVDEYYENNGFIEEEIYEENLGDDFEDTPWVPPSLTLAEEYKRKHIWREGKADPFAFDITQVPDLGIGIFYLNSLFL